MKTFYLSRFFGCLFLIALFSLNPNAARSAVTDVSTQLAYQVETVKYDWVDAKRDRKVPVKIYYPKDSTNVLPVIIFSHGLGGSRESYEYLGRYWATHGYVSVHVQHVGSDDSVWRGVPPNEIIASMKRSLSTNNVIDRPLDISFAIDQVFKLNEHDPVLKGRLDLQEIGVSGHSFGAYTTMAVAGEVYLAPSGKEVSMSDSRVKAVIAMSTPKSRRDSDRDRDHAYSRITIPCFHMTGTEDNSPIGETTPIERRIPFDHTKNVDDYLVTFTGGDHMIFSGRFTGRREKDAEFQKLICTGSTAFWDAYLKGDAKAKTWLSGTGFSDELGKEGVFEKKLATK